VVTITDLESQGCLGLIFPVDIGGGGGSRDPIVGGDTHGRDIREFRVEIDGASQLEDFGQMRRYGQRWRQVRAMW
jgi:hypothetical protein